ncbi:MAG: beta-propeller domain-containing protein, partial [Archaeoglobaceae archaeon]
MRSLVILMLVVVALLAFLVIQSYQKNASISQVASFSSPEEFREYISKASAYGYPALFGRAISVVATPAPVPAVDVGIAEKSEVERVSQTNVQVLGIDEPDIVKTDGKNIYISSYRRIPYFAPKIMPPYPYEPKTAVVKAFPPKELEKIRELNISGDMLIYQNILIFLSGNDLRAFSTDDCKEKYKVELNGSIV